MPSTTELMCFALQPGQEQHAEQWMKLLAERDAECVQTLDREAMHVASIFKTTMGERMVLCWYSVQGEYGAPVSSSSFEIDQLHMQFCKECIDRSMPPLTSEHVVSFLPPTVDTAIADREAALFPRVEP